jgi:hypothetical protein
MIALAAGIEADLADLPQALEQLPVICLTLGPAEMAWRSLFLSLEAVPSRILLVGRLDDVPELAALPDDPATLVLETDGEALSIGRQLPPRVAWRSLAGSGLGEAERVRVVAALINAFRPSAILAWGSHAGGEAISRHGGNFRVDARIHVVWADGPTRGAADLAARHFRRSLPFTTLSYARDVPTLHAMADRFGLPAGPRAQFRPIDAWRAAEGFLGPEPQDP